MKLSLVSKRYPNNTNLKHYQSSNNNKEGEDAAVAVVNFKKLKEKGEEKMQALRKRMVELDFKEEFIEKILREYSVKKIEDKLELLLERRNIQNPPAWLSAALKKDYRGEEQESQPTPPPSRGKTVSSIEYREIDSRFRGNDIKGSGNDIDTSEWTSREEALKAIKLIQDNLSVCISPLLSRERAGGRKMSELKELISKAKRKDLNAMGELFNQFKPLLKSRAKRYSRMGLEYDDIFQQVP